MPFVSYSFYCERCQEKIEFWGLFFDKEETYYKIHDWKAHNKPAEDE